MKHGLIAAVLATTMLQAGAAHAFNVRNDTAWPICVLGNKGNYTDIVGSGSTNAGWNLNSDIEISIVPFDESVCVGEYGQNCTNKCNESRLTTVKVPAHAQLHVTGTTYEPGDIGDHRRVKQWVMWTLGAPARFDWNLQ